MSNLISLLVITENKRFETAAKNILSQSSLVGVSGYVSNLSEALMTAPSLRPEVILMDMTSVNKHESLILNDFVNSLLIPVIVVADLSKQNLNLCFECLKNGAVDFIDKQDITPDNRSKIEDIIISAGKLEIKKISTANDTRKNSPSVKKTSIVVFCEDCGARNIFQIDPGNPKEKFYCSQCDDLLEPQSIPRYKKPNFVTILAAGSGSYRNLLRIIPYIPSEIAGAILIILSESIPQVDHFTEYIASISPCRIQRLKNDISIEGGCCYIAAGAEGFFMKPFSTRNTMKSSQTSADQGVIDLVMASTADVFKNNTAGFFLSGLELDGETGIKAINKEGGSSAVLYFADCLHRQMGENILRKCKIDKIVGENDAAQFITKLHKTSTESQSIA